MRLLLTGAAGFIGYHFAQRLLSSPSAEPVQVLGLDNLNDYYNPALKRARLAHLEARPGWEFVQGDFADEATVRSIFERFQPDHVVHLGAQAGVRYSVERPSAYMDSNLRGFFNLLEACRAAKVRHLLFASSSTVYGANTKVPFSEEDPTDSPVSFYGATKKANEAMAHSYAHLHNLPATGLRFFTVYGPWGRPDLGIAVFARAIWEGRTLQLFNHGKNRRDFTYVDDVVEAMQRLLNQPPTRGAGLVSGKPAVAPLRIYNIGNHQPVEILECVRLLEHHLGREAKVELTPAIPADMPATYADTRLLSAAVAFAPRTTLDEGLARYCTWFREHPELA